MVEKSKKTFNQSLSDVRRLKAFFRGLEDLEGVLENAARAESAVDEKTAELKGLQELIATRQSDLRTLLERINSCRAQHKKQLEDTAAQLQAAQSENQERRDNLQKAHDAFIAELDEQLKTKQREVAASIAALEEKEKVAQAAVDKVESAQRRLAANLERQRATLGG